MGGFFGVASKEHAILELLYGTDYHSPLGTRRGGWRRAPGSVRRGLGRIRQEGAVGGETESGAACAR
jgi:hypothetical protein